MTRRPRGGWLAPVGVLAVACTTTQPSPEAPAVAGPLELPALTAPARPPQHVLLISVAGMTPAAYLARDGREAPMPTVAQLAAAGVAAEAVEPAAPAATYPVHGTYVTGRAPARHGVPADRLLGERGVRATRYWHASHLISPTLWQVASEARIRVAALGWPSTLGAAIDQLVPDVRPVRRGESWPAVVVDGTTPQLLELMRRHGGEQETAGHPGPLRDSMFAGVACDLLSSAAPPGLLLLRFSQTEPVLLARGLDAPQLRVAFRRVDEHIARLLACLRDTGRLEASALFVVGDRGNVSIHTIVLPNFVLAQAGLLAASSLRPGELERWDAIARSNGGSAFVYAHDEAAAVQARKALAAAAEESGAFRIVSAEEMLRMGADSEAWFGIEAELGYAFGDAVEPHFMLAAPFRSGGGYLPDRPEMRSGLAAWGRGVRSGIRVPIMRQTDVAPTLAALLGLRLEDADGRPLVGILRESRLRRARR